MVGDALRGSGADIVGVFEDAAGRLHCGYHGFPLSAIADGIDEVVALEPDVVVLQAAGNALPDGAPWEVERDAGRILRALAKVDKVYVCSVTDVLGHSRLIDRYNAALRSAAARAPNAQMLEVGHHLGRVTPNSSVFADICHPTQKGYDILGTLICRGVFGLHVDAPDPSAHFGATLDPFIHAREALREVYPALERPVVQTALAIGAVETRFGLEGSFAPQGIPSNNWGRTRASSRCPMRLTVDGVEYCRFPNLAEGLTAWYEPWATPDMLAAAKAGDLARVAGLLGRDRAYAARLHDAAKHAADVLDEPLVVRVPSSPASLANLAVLVATLGLFGATLMLRPKG